MPLEGKFSGHMWTMSSYTFKKWHDFVWNLRQGAKRNINLQEINSRPRLIVHEAGRRLDISCEVGDIKGLKSVNLK